MAFGRKQKVEEKDFKQPQPEEEGTGVVKEDETGLEYKENNQVDEPKPMQGDAQSLINGTNEDDNQQKKMWIDIELSVGTTRKDSKLAKKILELVNDILESKDYEKDELTDFTIR